MHSTSTYVCIHESRVCCLYWHDECDMTDVFVAHLQSVINQIKCAIRKACHSAECVNINILDKLHARNRCIRIHHKIKTKRKKKAKRNNLRKQILASPFKWKFIEIVSHVWSSVERRHSTLSWSCAHTLNHVSIYIFLKLVISIFLKQWRKFKQNVWRRSMGFWWCWRIYTSRSWYHNSGCHRCKLKAKSRQTNRNKIQ